MKLFLIIVLILVILIPANSQKQKYQSIAIYNTHTAMPFGKFSTLFGEIFHPGLEYGYGKLIKEKERHCWVTELKVSVFYHRFLQVGIPMTYNVGYRYKFSTRFSTDVALGAGYLHAIPATSKYKLNSQGEYKNNKGIGRMQATANLNLSVGYLPQPARNRPLRFFAVYQQRLQMPFVKSYVPVLPYNIFMIGVSKPIKSVEKK